MKRFSPTASAIIRTLLYARVFGTGIARPDLYRLLLTPSMISTRSLSTALRPLARQNIIQLTNDYVWIGEMRIGALLKKRREESERKEEFLKAVLPLVTWIPTLQGIAVTGSVAVGNASAREDIDLMIITRSGFLWSTRAVVEIILLMRGVLRMRGMRDVRNKLCLNLWLDEGSLALAHRSLYVARELAQVRWVYSSDNVPQRMFAANAWIRAYVANALLAKKINRRSIREHVLVRFVCAPLEYLAFFLQTTHMRTRTREVISLRMAFFHPRDTQSDVQERFKKLCGKYKIDSLV